MSQNPKHSKGAEIRVTLPDTMSDAEKIKSIKNLKRIIKTFEKVAGEEGATDFSGADKAIKELQDKNAQS